jgi:hypothetical protein
VVALQIEEVIGLLRKYCPKGVVNSAWDTDRWHILVYKVHGVDGSPGFYNDLTPEMLGRLNEKSVKNMAGIINGFLGGTQ